MENREQKIILQIYAALAGSLLLSFVPMISAVIFSLILFFGVWITASFLRHKATPDSLVKNHMGFLIRTIWITGLFSLVTMSIATAYLLSVYNSLDLVDCVGTVTTTDMAALEAAIRPCMDDFMRINMPYFINATLIAATPLVLYMTFRLIKGLSRALKGHRMGNLKCWF